MEPHRDDKVLCQKIGVRGHHDDYDDDCVPHDNAIDSSPSLFYLEVLGVLEVQEVLEVRVPDSQVRGVQVLPVLLKEMGSQVRVLRAQVALAQEEKAQEEKAQVEKAQVEKAQEAKEPEWVVSDPVLLGLEVLASVVSDQVLLAWVVLAWVISVQVLLASETLK